MSVTSESTVHQIGVRAQAHRNARAERWRQLGFPVPQASTGPADRGGPELPLVSIVLPTHRPDKLENCRHSIVSQQYPHLEVIVVLNNDAYDEALVHETFAGVPRLQVLRVPASRNLGSCINLGAASATGVYIAKIDDDDFYGPSYISDLVLAALESGADIVGKKATFFCFQEGRDYWFRGSDLRNRWLWPLTDETGRRVCPDILPRSGSIVLGATLFSRREVLREFHFDECLPGGTDTLFQVTCRRAGMTIYAADEFNFCCMRRDSGEGHLWRKTRERFLKNAIPLPLFDCSQVCV